jgi:hypothetical protein
MEVRKLPVSLSGRARSSLMDVVQKILSGEPWPK